jgi:proline-specific peptidase
MAPTKTGYIKYLGFQTYYETYGTDNSSKTPLLVLHGGPGSAHNYLLGLSKLARGDRQIIFYDQLGCGESSMPVNDSLWTIELFVNEVAAIREALGLDRIHLLGHSWGGMLAIEYLLRQPGGVQTTTLASSMISMPLYQEEVEKLKSKLPGTTYEVMKEHEAAGSLDSEEYKQAYAVYRKNHLFRGGTFPKEYDLGPSRDGQQVYHKMWGPNEAYSGGTLRDWDRINDLSQITIPTLITSGQYDELTPWQAGITSNHLPNSELRIFTNGSHLTHIEYEEEYLDVVGRFLDAHEPETKT